jgi:hypothetical protein
MRDVEMLHKCDAGYEIRDGVYAHYIYTDTT